MKKLLVLPILFVCSIHLFAQEPDTIWFDKGWKKTNKHNGYYYRIQKFNTSNNTFVVEDYHPTGEIQMTGSYFSMNPEIKDGTFIWYYKNGKKHREFVYSMNSLIQLAGWDINGNPIELKQAEFSGGMTKLAEYLARKIKYPKDALEKNISGKVVVQFTINEEGEISDATVIQSAYPSLDREALRVVNKMPKWSPAVDDGEKVKLSYVLPITFTIPVK